MKPIAYIQKLFPANIPFRDFFFIPLFFAFYFTLKVFEPATFFLEQFNGRSVSIATAEGIDITTRVSLFYKGFAFATVLILLFTRLTIIIRDFCKPDELHLANGISLAGLSLLFFTILGADLSDSIHFIFALLIICLAGLISNSIKKRDDRDYTTLFMWTITVSVSLFFLQWQISNFVFGKNIFSLPKVLILTGVPVYLLFTGRLQLNDKIFKSSQPLIFLPLLSFISVELFMIFNQHGIYLPPKIIYAVCLIGIVLRMIFLYKKKKTTQTNKTLLTIIFHNRIPWLLAGIACIALYQPVIQPEIDWFEDAHHVLPIHQLFSFGKVPFLDSFSGHGLSEFGFGLLYSFFNGADPLGDFVYHFMIKVFIILIVYFFIYKISSDGFLATWIAIAYPYTEMLIPSYFNFVPVVALIIILLYEKQTVTRYFCFFFSLIFMLFWRIDLGSSTLIAGLASFIFMSFFIPSFTLNKKSFFRGLGISLGILLLLLSAALIHSGAGLFSAIKDVLAYSSSFQSYGIKDLSLSHDIKYFSLYFISPAVVLLILIYSAFRSIRNVENNSKSIIFYLAILFLGLFYFFNFQRGLVRHTLSEQWDTALTSYSFFIIASFILIKYFDRNIYTRFFVFFTFSTLLISNYVFTAPDLKQKNFYSSLTYRLNNPISLVVSKEKIDRTIEDPALEKGYSAFSNWMKNNFSDTATFLDFSNTPMLYYFTNRIVPDYFLQIPHTAHNDFLQNCLLDNLKKYDIPVTIFSGFPAQFWDNLDGIPNSLRHYRIAEYIYRNYSPAFIINNHSLWLKNNLKLSSELQKDTVSNSPVTYSLKWIPFIWGAYDKKFRGGKIRSEQNIYSGNKILMSGNENKFPFNSLLDKGSGNYILISALSKSGLENSIVLNYGTEEEINGSFTFNLKNDTLVHDYLIRVSSQYCWYSKQNNLFSVAPIKNDIELTKVEIFKGD